MRSSLQEVHFLLYVARTDVDHDGDVHNFQYNNNMKYPFEKQSASSGIITRFRCATGGVTEVATKSIIPVTLRQDFDTGFERTQKKRINTTTVLHSISQ